MVILLSHLMELEWDCHFVYFISSSYGTSCLDVSTLRELSRILNSSRDILSLQRGSFEDDSS